MLFVGVKWFHWLHYSLLKFFFLWFYSLGLWQRSHGSSRVVQEVHEIRKCQRPNSGLGSLLSCVPTYLKAAATGEGGDSVLLWVLQFKLSIPTFALCYLGIQNILIQYFGNNCIGFAAIMVFMQRFCKFLKYWSLP